MYSEKEALLVKVDSLQSKIIRVNEELISQSKKQKETINRFIENEKQLQAQNNLIQKEFTGIKLELAQKQAENTLLKKQVKECRALTSKTTESMKEKYTGTYFI